MDPLSVLVLAAQLPLALLAVATAIRLAIQPSKAGTDTVILLGTLALPALAGMLASADLPGTRAYEAVGSVALVAHPLALSHGIRRLRHPTRRDDAIHYGILACTAASAVAVSVPPPPIPLVFGLPVAIFFGIAEIYLAVELARHTLRQSGLARRKGRLAVAGSLMLLVVAGTTGLSLSVPALAPTLDPASHLLALGAGIAYVSAFFPPALLRRSWQMQELMRHLGSLPEDRAAPEPVLRHLASTARDLFDTERVFLVLAERPGRALFVDERGDRVGTRILEGTLAALWRGEQASHHAPLDDLGTVVAAGVVHGASRFGVIVVVHRPDMPLYEDDAALLAMLTRLTASHLDRTEEAHRQARDARSRLSAIVESSQDAIFSKDLDGRILSWNRGAERLYGYTAAEVVGRSIETLVPENLRGELRQVLEAVGRGEPVEQLRTMRRHKNGHLIDVSLTTSPLYQDNQLVGSSVIVRDIRWEVRAQRELAQSWERYRDLFENAPIGYLDLDHEHRIVAANREAAAMFGRALRMLIGQPWIDLLRPSDHAWYAEHLPTLARGGTIRESCAIDRPDGTRIWVELVASGKLAEDGTLAHARATLLDITALRRVEQRLQRHVEELARSNDELQQFAYVASHDLKAPLRGISTLAGWIREDLPANAPDETRENLDLLLGRVSRMERLLSDVLALAKAGSPVEATEVALTDLLGDLSALVDLPVGFELVIRAEPRTIHTPQAALQQVLKNLVENALKHHDRPSGRIEVAVEEGGDGQLAFSVTDDGPGIDPKYHERIFAPFQTLRPRDEVEGSGMGLAIVKKTVERFGGRVTVASGPGRGSTFRLTWPVRWPPHDLAI